VLKVLCSHSLGSEAAIIGEVVNEHPGLIMMKTRVGGTRVVDMLSGEQLPRICYWGCRIRTLKAGIARWCESNAERRRDLSQIARLTEPPMFLWRQPCRLQKGGCGRHARHYRYCSGAATVGKSDCLSALIERRYRKRASVT